MEDFTMTSVDVSVPEQHNTLDEEIMYNLLHQENAINNDNVKVILATWKTSCENYIERYKVIVDEMCETYNDLLNTSEYVANLKLPFCWEYIRLIFGNELHQLLGEFQDFDKEISTFENEMDIHRNLSIRRGDIKLSDSSLDYLDSVLDYYAHKSSCIKNDLAYLKKRGQEAFIDSQQICINCGDDKF